jgi:hypothetical protein
MIAPFTLPDSASVPVDLTLKVMKEEPEEISRKRKDSVDNEGGRSCKVSRLRFFPRKIITDPACFLIADACVRV